MVTPHVLAAALVMLVAGAASAAPQRVVSANLCTDQLAMLLAGPEQLISITYLSQDPLSSPMADDALGYGVNHGLAEEVYLLEPDLVLVGEYSTLSLTALLQRLEVPVEVFPVAQDFEGMRDNITRMGEVLGRQGKAKEIIRDFDAALAAISGPEPVRHSAAIYYADGFTAASDSLASRIIEAAGFENLVDRIGLTDGGILPLEALVLASPDLLVRGRHFGGTSRAEQVTEHPALRFLPDGDQPVLVDRDWSCGTPHILQAITRLTAARHKLEEDSAP